MSRIRSERLARIISILSVSFVLFVGAGVAVADNDVGCGVGTQIWEGEEGVGYKLLASFTNGITFQSVSITFGLINCNGQDKVTADANELRLRHFASVNFDRLAEEMAMGRGERLDALAALLDVPEAQRGEFASLTQRNFGKLFSHDHVTVGEMLSELRHQMVEQQLVASAS